MILRLFKWALGLLAVLLCVAAAFVINAVYFRPWSINVFYEKVFVRVPEYRGVAVRVPGAVARSEALAVAEAAGVEVVVPGAERVLEEVALALREALGLAVDVVVPSEETLAL